MRVWERGERERRLRQHLAGSKVKEKRQDVVGSGTQGEDRQIDGDIAAVAPRLDGRESWMLLSKPCVVLAVACLLGTVCGCGTDSEKYVNPQP